MTHSAVSHCHGRCCQVLACCSHHEALSKCFTYAVVYWGPWVHGPVFKMWLGHQLYVKAPPHGMPQCGAQ